MLSLWLTLFRWLCEITVSVFVGTRYLKSASRACRQYLVPQTLRMSESGTQSLFFTSLPDLKHLCCVYLFFQNHYDEGELRNKQVKTCRELVLLYSDIIAAPVLGRSGGITVVMAITFYRRGIIQAFAQKHDLQSKPPQRVSPAILQTCMSYSVTARLAPEWNKAGQHLIAGNDFLCDSGKLNAVALELSITETQLCVSVEVCRLRLPPARIEDFDFPSPVVKNFLSHNDAVLHTRMPNDWCHILPSMKKGQIISISHRIPQECPFQSYTEFQRHWNSMYGYQLPSVSEEEVIYCSVYFKLIGEKLFTYPLCCIRTQPVQCFPRTDQQGVLGSFISDLRAALKSVCGFPVRMSSKPCYYTHTLSRPHYQGYGVLPVNLTTKTTSKAALNQLPSSSPQNPPQRSAPSSTSQHNSASQWNEKKNNPSLESSLDRVPQRGWTSSNSTARPTDVHLAQSQSRPAFERPKLIPIFKNKSLTRHVNVTRILAEKQKGRIEGQKLMTVKRPLSLSSLMSFSSADCSTPQALSHQFCRPIPERVSLPFSKGQKASSGVSMLLPRQPLVNTQPQPVPESPSNNSGLVFESKPKRLKLSVQDVEMYAKSNQFAKLNSATLQAWLKSRGVDVRSKDKKDELVSKVMKCLSET